jgi:hypothetical protein
MCGAACTLRGGRRLPLFAWSGYTIRLLEKSVRKPRNAPPKYYGAITRVLVDITPSGLPPKRGFRAHPIGRDRLTKSGRLPPRIRGTRLTAMCYAAAVLLPLDASPGRGPVCGMRPQLAHLVFVGGTDRDAGHRIGRVRWLFCPAGGHLTLASHNLHLSRSARTCRKAPDPAPTARPEDDVTIIRRRCKP